MKINKKKASVGPDPNKIAEATEKFDRVRQFVEAKKYGILLNEEQTTFLFDVFFNEVEWKGYESYAISETYKNLKSLENNGKISNEAPPEIIEAVFHFLKNYVSRGHKHAQTFREICDQFSLPMQEINKDRQELRDVSLELTAAEQGITVENLIEQYQNANQ